MEILKTIWDCIYSWVVNHHSWIAEIISATSLVIAVISLIKSSGAQRLQNKVNKLELQLKQYELDRIKEEEGKSCVEARVYAIGSGKYRIKVWNSGNTTAYKINLTISKDANIIICDDDKLPFDELESKKSFEIAIIYYPGGSSKFKITTEWDDQSGQHQSKVQMADI